MVGVADDTRYNVGCIDGGRMTRSRWELRLRLRLRSRSHTSP